jgi:hypothetical protein
MTARPRHPARPTARKDQLAMTASGYRSRRPSTERNAA